MLGATCVGIMCACTSSVFKARHVVWGRAAHAHAPIDDGARLQVREDMKMCRTNPHQQKVFKRSLKRSRRSGWTFGFHTAHTRRRHVHVQHTSLHNLTSLPPVAVEPPGESRAFGGHVGARRSLELRRALG